MLFDEGMQHSVNIYSSLFNQGPNSPKFHGNPPHLVSTLVLLCTVLPLLHISYIKVISTGVVQGLSVFMFTRSINYVFSLPQTANQKASSGARRLSGEGGDPDVSAIYQCEFVYFVRTAGSHLHNKLPLGELLWGALPIEAL